MRLPSREEAANLGSLVASDLMQQAGTNFFNAEQEATTPL